MCLLVYIGLDAPLEGYSSPEVGKFGLEPDPDPVPKALAHRKVVYGVTQFGDSVWCCSCDLYHHHLPWEPEQPGPETMHAYDVVRKVVADAESRSVNPVLFSCWNGDEAEPIVVEWELSCDHLVPENNLFEENEVTGGAFPPPSVFKFRKGLDAPKSDYKRAWARYRG